MEFHQYLSISKKPLDKNDKQLICYVNCPINQLFLIIYNKENEEVDKLLLDPISLFDNLSFYNNIKAVIFNINDFQHPDYSNNICYRLMVAEKLRKQNIPFRFLTPLTFITTLPLAAANVHLKFDEIVLIVLPQTYQWDVYELRRTNEGYIIENGREFKYDSTNKNFEKMKTVVIGSRSPKLIIAADFLNKYPAVMKNLQKNILKSKKLIAIPSIRPIEQARALEAMVKRINDSSFNDFHVINKCEQSTFVSRGCCACEKADLLLSAKTHENLPINKTTFVSKSKERLFLSTFDSETDEICNISKIDPIEEKCHRIKVSLVIDENYLPNVYQEPFIIPGIESMPNILNSKKILNIPVIAIFDNTSVICLQGENGYEFMKSWNGLYGSDMYLCFDQKKPRLIKDITEVDFDDTSMVYDLLKIMSRKPENIEGNVRWNFSITKDNDNHVLVEFDYFDGTRKASSPSFLMALILKNHLKAIKAEIGIKPNKIGFYFVDEYSMEERNNLEFVISEACKLLKIDFIFVEHP